MRETEDIGSAERCRLPQSMMDALGVQADQQVRLVYDGEAAVFTVARSDDTFGYINTQLGESVCDQSGSSARGCETLLIRIWTKSKPQSEVGLLERTTESDSRSGEWSGVDTLSQ